VEKKQNATLPVLRKIADWFARIAASSGGWKCFCFHGIVHENYSATCRIEVLGPSWRKAEFNFALRLGFDLGELGKTLADALDVSPAMGIGRFLALPSGYQGIPGCFTRENQPAEGLVTRLAFPSLAAVCNAAALGSRTVSCNHFFILLFYETYVRSMYDYISEVFTVLYEFQMAST